MLIYRQWNPQGNLKQKTIFLILQNEVEYAAWHMATILLRPLSVQWGFYRDLQCHKINNISVHVHLYSMFVFVAIVLDVYRI